MSIGQAVFGFRGRISRRTYWLAMLGVYTVFFLIAGAAEYLVTGRLRLAVSSSDAPLWPAIFASLMVLVLWPSLAISLKRWHDHGLPSWPIFLYYVLCLCAALTVPFLSDIKLVGLHMLFSSVLDIFWIVLIIVLGFIKGNVGPNRYGPDPLPPEAHDDPVKRAFQR